ncbi:tRNAHis guanylyltransferase [Hysterangium stoloniferum]|nr:tRNAHis guanylyltransferase [Hysterangium stoloniferum]
MAGSKYAYVKSFELPDPLLPNTFLVARLDGHGFHRFADEHGFIKPNDTKALELMDHAAQNVMQEYSDIMLAFGESDEYSFLFRKSCTLYNRRATKIVTTITSLFTSSYVMLWPRYFPDKPLKYPPSFDGRLVIYPSEKEVRDYFSWRQTDTHINNLYNTVFWALVQEGGQTTTQAHEILRGTISSQKHEILHSRFDINYNTLPARFRKGSVVVRQEIPPPQLSISEADPLPSGESASSAEATLHIRSKKQSKKKPEYEISVVHVDIIKDAFWLEHPNILTA